jgi:hypothetical protein
MTRWMLVFEERDANILWLCRAVPRRWFQREFSFRGALTCWGPVSLCLNPINDLRRMTAKITLTGDVDPKPTIILRIRHPERLSIATCDVTGGECEEVDARREAVRLRLNERTATVALGFRL